MKNKEVDTASVLADKNASLADAVLVVSTNRDGFTDTYEGRHFFQVKEDKGTLKVYPMAEGQDTDKPMQMLGDHIIEATKDSVVIVAGALYDPSGENGASTAHQSLVTGGINAGVLTAFSEYAQAKYTLGTYNNFVSRAITVILPEEPKPEEPKPEEPKPEEPKKEEPKKEEPKVD